MRKPEAPMRKILMAIGIGRRERKKYVDSENQDGFILVASIEVGDKYDFTTLRMDQSIPHQQ